MTVPVWVEEQGGRFVASVLGSPQLRADADTKDAAVAALVSDLSDRRSRGELMAVNVPDDVAAWPARAYSPDDLAVMREAVAGMYRERDEEKSREFPE